MNYRTIGLSIIGPVNLENYRTIDYRIKKINYRTIDYRIKKKLSGAHLCLSSTVQMGNFEHVFVFEVELKILLVIILLFFRFKYVYELWCIYCRGLYTP